MDGVPPPPVPAPPLPRPLPAPPPLPAALWLNAIRGVGLLLCVIGGGAFMEAMEAYLLPYFGKAVWTRLATGVILCAIGIFLFSAPDSRRPPVSRRRKATITFGVICAAVGSAGVPYTLFVMDCYLFCPSDGEVLTVIALNAGAIALGGILLVMTR